MLTPFTAAFACEAFERCHITLGISKHVHQDQQWMNIGCQLHLQNYGGFRQKEAAAANRKDSKLKAVVISEAWDKKSSKYNSPTVPFPYDSKTTYEQSMRTPMGREYNTTAAHR